MEIINYYTQETAVRRPRFTRTRAKAIALPKRRVPVKELYYDAKAKIMLAATLAKKCIRYIWLLPALALLFCIPVLISRVIDYTQSFAKVVEFDSADDVDYFDLDEAMSLFAMEMNYYDSEGNILAADGSLLNSAGVIKDAVTYQTYTVRAGDTISGITYRFGLSNISTLIAVNGISNVRSLRSGQKLKIPSYDGLVHTVLSGETLSSVAKKYNASVEDILDVNDLSSETLQTGMALFIPGAKLDSDTLRRAMGELFAYPITASWRLSSRFGPRTDPIKGTASNHTGIDMACPEGTPIYAAMSGTVAYTGFSSVYGNYVIITHYDGYQTLYAHMSKIIAKKGTVVSQGTKIGLVGSTGYSTGPHLHFSVYKNGKLIDPLTVLK